MNIRDELNKRLIGIDRKPTFLSGIERVEYQALTYSNNPRFWPLDKDNNPQALINWCGQGVRLSESNLHFMIAGIPGTGKTACFQGLIESVFSPKLRPHLGGTDRAILYDPKGDAVPFLDGIGYPGEKVFVLNPYDRRSFAWDLAADINDPAAATQFAKCICPAGENLSQPFFAKASAAILAAVVLEHIKLSPRNWDFGEIIMDCLDEGLLLRRLQSAQRNPYNTSAISSLAKGDTRASVLSELTTSLNPYISTAACLRAGLKKGRRFSLHDFVNSNGSIAILGGTDEYSETLSPLNRLFLRRFSEIALSHPDASRWNANNRTWLLLDELKELGKVPEIVKMISKGRSKGICVVLGFQDFSGLKESFGQDAANELTSCCHHHIFLKLKGESAEWASKCIGQTEIEEVSLAVKTGSSITANFHSSRTLSTGGTSAWSGNTSNWSDSKTDGQGFQVGLSHDVTLTKQPKVKDAVLPSEISGLPGFDEGDGITGFTSEYCDEARRSVVRKFHLPKQFITFPSNDSELNGFESWRDGELEW
jgi:hypothetical protein